MPNWNSNIVTICAPLADVQTYFVPASSKYRFNMHLLFPDRFDANDPEGQQNRNYHWFIDHTGAKWAPFVEIEGKGKETRLIYDTAREPNNKTLERLHQLTGWTIVNEYVEPGMLFEGTFRCQDGACSDDLREHHLACEVCNLQHPPEYYEPEGEWGHIHSVCKACRKRERHSRPKR